jgi:hypothetical protein
MRSARSVSIVTISTLDGTSGGGAGACVLHADVHAAPDASATKTHAALTNISGRMPDYLEMWKFGNLKISTFPNFPISKCRTPA